MFTDTDQIHIQYRLLRFWRVWNVRRKKAIVSNFLKVLEDGRALSHKQKSVPKNHSVHSVRSVNGQAVDEKYYS